MHLKTRLQLAISTSLACLTLCVCAADFAPPAIGPVAFRRDQVPLAAWTMAGLSRNLGTIARALPGETAAQRQAAARALALAIALDPANEEPRKLIDIYQNGRRTPDADVARLAESQARIWQLIAWLQTPEAGPQGQALASCLQDVIAVSDPKHPQAAALREAGDKGAWAGWVPDIHAYESRKIAATSPTEPQVHKPDYVGKTPEILLPKASVQSIFPEKTGTGRSTPWAFAPAPLQMRALRSPQDGNDNFSITIGPEGSAESLMAPAMTVRHVLEKQHGKLPSRMSVRISGGDFMRTSVEGKIIVPEVTAAAAVLGSAAITGREPEATIIGRVEESGAFKLPARFWDQLQALGSDKYRRVVLPAAAADWLPAFVAMEDPGIFLDHEILLAADFGQLLDLSVKSPDGALKDASEKFREIRERGEGQDLRTYVANRYVRQRLEEIVKVAPFHASAAMLLLQGSMDRPRQMNRPALASELRRAIEPMAWIGQLGYLDANSKEVAEFSTIYKSCRLNVDKLERFVEKSDLDLWESSRDVTAALWKLNRVAHGRGDYNVVLMEIQTALKDLTRLYNNLSEQLDRAAADTAR
jgi:hypothetical protein